MSSISNHESEGIYMARESVSEFTMQNKFPNATAWVETQWLHVAYGAAHNGQINNALCCNYIVAYGSFASNFASLPSHPLPPSHLFPPSICGLLSGEFSGTR